ncbi:type II toxin-antitoxin system HicA family toxin [uncultured Psychrobacter sp.]|uniref:type II toxin-antitoxin system HicA family toxin n=1 Tax=uncultured Psychrobacter sp. TaxID=259303 RepID=UPI0034576DB5
MKSSKLIKLLQDDGWVVDRIKGSHHILRKEGIDSIISISHPEKDVSRHQLAQARRISGLKL